MEKMEIHPQISPSKEEEKAENSKLIVLMLMGAPGSGKSTFCELVMQSSNRPWTRICQDTIGNGGKAGTRSQCLTRASSALKDGSSVLIDRCNIDREQRSEFLKLGGDEVEKHCVILDLPAKVCISRVAKRTGHEGNLQGGKAAAVVNRVLQRKELPKLSEGFSRIMHCVNEENVEAEVDTYRKLGSVDTLPSGYFGKKNPDSKIQLGIMRFLKKVDPPANIQSKSDVQQDMSQDNVSSKKVSPCKPCKAEEYIPAHSDMKSDVPLTMAQDEVSVEKMSVSEAEEIGPADSGARNDVPQDMTLDEVSVKTVSVCKEEDSSPDRSDVRNNEKSDSANETSSTENVPTLAFPSISTADFHFDLEEASSIIVEKVEEYIDKLGNARLVLVDISLNSKILALVRRKIAQRIDSSKFFTFVGDITQLYSRRGLRCNVIANATNWRLKPGGGGVNAAVFNAAGPEFESATKERATSLRPGNAVIVPIPSTSPLFNREGVTHVVHVLGPNMNPQRPDCLNNDYVEGRNVLQQAYSSLFEAFISVVESKEASSLTASIENSLERQDDPYGSPFKDDEKGRGREALDQRGNNKRCKGFYKELGTEAFYSVINQEAPKNKETKGTSRTWGSYAQSLYYIAMHPERHKNVVIEVSEDVVVINDLYAKAQKHLLVLARVEGLDSLADVDEEHLSLLNRMHHVGLKHAENLLKDDESLIFRLGYHSVPSMRQLHLHVISQDFNSKHLKNKKHWNSFNTPFFLDSVDVIEEVSQKGKPTLVDDESFLKMELRCHRCRSAHPNIPRLKAHVTACQAPFPSSLQQNGRLIFGVRNVRRNQQK